MARAARRVFGRRVVGHRVPALAVGLAVCAIAGVALTLAHHQPRPPVSPPVAIRAALHAPKAAQALAGAHWNRVEVNRLDDRLDDVSFFAGSRLVAEVAVQRGQVLATIDARQMRVPYGDWIAYEPALLVVLSALFVLMAGVAPWRRLRNLDVAATVSLVIPVVLFQHRFLAASMVALVPPLGYLMARLLATAFGRARVPAQCRPLLAAITPGLDPARRVRWLRLALAAFALLYLMVGVSSPDAVDVLYAVMEGATAIVHGVLPYGHLPPGIIHGDTYPILSYAVYTPLALVAPVSSVWDSVDGGLAVAVLAAFLAAWALHRMRAGGRVSDGVRRAPALEEAGLRAALAWLAFPPLLITVSTGTTDVTLAAMLAVALLLWRRPAACAAVLAFAGWFKLAPFALLPLSLAPLRGRRLMVALAAVALVSGGALAVVLGLGGIAGLSDMVHAISYQFSRGSLQSIWSALGIAALQPLAQAAVLGLLAGSVVTLRRRPDLAGDRVRMAALAGALLIGLQLVAQYWAFLYLAWVMPLIVTSVLAAPEPVAEPAGQRAALAATLAPAPASAG